MPGSALPFKNSPGEIYLTRWNPGTLLVAVDDSVVWKTTGLLSLIAQLCGLTQCRTTCLPPCRAFGSQGGSHTGEHQQCAGRTAHAPGILGRKMRREVEKAVPRQEVSEGPCRPSCGARGASKGFSGKMRLLGSVFREPSLVAQGGSEWRGHSGAGKASQEEQQGARSSPR